MLKSVNINWESNIGNWYKRKEIKEFLHSPYVNRLLKFILQESYKTTVYPDRQFIFKSFLLCNPEDVRVVIIGNGLYNDGSATGLAFANNQDRIYLSSSLVTIQKCIERTIYNGLQLDPDPTLESWSKQGVLLLNTALTTGKGVGAMHTKPWNRFIKFFIKYISENYPSTIFLLWGEKAQQYKNIDGINLSDKNYVFECSCPVISSYNNEEWDCDHFVKVNKLLTNLNGKDYSIKW